LPVLGSVSLIVEPFDRALTRRRTLVFSAVAAALPVALALAVLLQEPGHRVVASLLGMLPS
jgi:hypothetical protein